MEYIIQSKQFHWEKFENMSAVPDGSFGPVLVRNSEVGLGLCVDLSVHQLPEPQF